MRKYIKYNYEHVEVVTNQKIYNNKIGLNS